MTGGRVLPQGTNIRILLQECQSHETFLIDAASITPQIFKAVNQAGLTPIRSTDHSFDGAGYTLAIILAESHIVIHTWPEHDNLVLVEISVCDFNRQNRERAIHLGTLLSALYQPKNELHEVTGMIPRLSETNQQGNGFFVEINRLIETRRSEYQNLIVADTTDYGRVLLLDGAFQTTENDEYFYHEPLVHIPMLAHPNPQHVLICGGGDGGSAKDVLRHPSVESCTIVDIDAEVIRASKEHLQCIHRGALEHPNVKIHIEDASKYLKHTEQTYDVILMDTTDPGGCSNPLFTKSFYQDTFDRLNDGGLIALHVGAPMCQPDDAKHAVQSVREIFSNAFSYFQFVPSYGTQMGFQLCSKTEIELPAHHEIAHRMEERSLEDLQLITPDTYHALFAIPPYLHDILPSNRSMEIAR